MRIIFKISNYDTAVKSFGATKNIKVRHTMPGRPTSKKVAKRREQKKAEENGTRVPLTHSGVPVLQTNTGKSKEAVLCVHRLSTGADSYYQRPAAGTPGGQA
jgi:hypothetical protein